jgi:tetratricopeptide (TPR) repeat protein
VSELIEGELFILQLSEFLDNGDGWYRFHGPCRQMARTPGVVAIDCDLNHRYLPELMESADILVLHGFDWELFPAIEKRRRSGRATVLEANDYYYDVQPWNSRAGMWLDRGTQEELRQCMAAVDAVQTSTEELARRWRPWSRQVAVFANHLEEIPPLPSLPSRPLTIGWGGSSGHFADWYAVAPIIEQWIVEHPGSRLAVMANEAAREFIGLPAERYEFRPFGAMGAYREFLQGVDIGLAPLLPTDFNRGRSDVKYLEYASAGAAGVYADVEPYRKSVAPEETGLLYRTAEELRPQLDRLAEDRGLRERIRRQAYDRVSRERKLADHIGERLSFYRGLLSGAPRGICLRQEIVDAARCDGRYLQLRPGQPEQAVAGAKQGPARREAAEQLAQLVSQLPGYLPALQQLGKLLNDLREPRQAEGYLERARQIDGSSARTLSELGRSRFLQGDRAGAQKLLEEALAINPHYGLGWQYLLRLLALEPGPAGAGWAKRSLELFPSNWNLALLSARVYPRGEAETALSQWLETYSAGLGPDERPAAASGFSQAARDVLGPRPAASAAELLRRGVEAFPESVRLLTLLGRSLEAAGKHAEGQNCFARALELRRSSATYQMEYAKEDLSVLQWQMGEHIRRWQGGAS